MKINEIRTNKYKSLNHLQSSFFRNFISATTKKTDNRKHFLDNAKDCVQDDNGPIQQMDSPLNILVRASVHQYSLYPQSDSPEISVHENPCRLGIFNCFSSQTVFYFEFFALDSARTAPFPLDCEKSAALYRALYNLATVNN